MRKISSLVTGAVAAVLFSTAASAATISVTWNSPVFNPASVNVGTVTFPSGSTQTNAGRFEGTVTATSGIDPAEIYQSTADFFAYCYQLNQTLSNTVYTVVPGASAVMLDFLGAVNSVLGTGAFSWLSPASSTIAAAVQLGIWEALYSDDFVLNAGLVSVNLASVPDNVETQFAAFVAAMGANSADLSSAFVMTLTSGHAQDVITGRVPPGFLVPEPGTVALLGLAALAAVARRRRR